MRVREADAIRGQAVDVGGIDADGAVAADVTKPKVVDVQDDDVGLADNSRGGAVVRAGSQPGNQDERREKPQYAQLIHVQLPVPLVTDNMQARGAK